MVLEELRSSLKSFTRSRNYQRMNSLVELRTERLHDKRAGLLLSIYSLSHSLRLHPHPNPGLKDSPQYRQLKYFLTLLSHRQSGQKFPPKCQMSRRTPISFALVIRSDFIRLRKTSGANPYDSTGQGKQTLMQGAANSAVLMQLFRSVITSAPSDFGG